MNSGDYPLHFDRTRKGPRPTSWLWWLLPIGLLLAALACGCDPTARLRDPSGYYVRPTIAAMSFESVSSPVGGWQIGEGLADILTEELHKTERFHVIERPRVGAVLGELRFQQGADTRAEGKQPPGKLKNVEYLITGKVTDFGHVSGGDFWANLDWLNVFGGRHRAVIRLTFRVVEVGSGEIVAGRTVQSSVRADESSLQVAYKDVRMGSNAFYRTPLGRVTAAATAKAVEEVVEKVASRPWHPRIAMIRNDEVYINGGADRGMEVGRFYRVLEAGEPIIDPETGDILGNLPGPQVGQLEIVRVMPRFSIARSATRSNYQVGQALELVPSKPK